MTYEEIFNATKKEVDGADASSLAGHLAVEVNISGEGAGAFYIELKDGNLYCEPYEYYDRDCKLIVSGEDFLKIMDGSLDAVKAFTVGKLKVEGSIDKALEFSKIVEKVRTAKKKAEKPAKASAEKKPAKSAKNAKKK